MRHQFSIDIKTEQNLQSQTIVELGLHNQKNMIKNFNNLLESKPKNCNLHLKNKKWKIKAEKKKNILSNKNQP